MQNFPYSERVSTNSAEGTTDSAAGATALATGTRTWNGYVGLTTEEEELTTIVDIAARWENVRVF